MRKRTLEEQTKLSKLLLAPELLLMGAGFREDRLRLEILRPFPKGSACWLLGSPEILDFLPLWWGVPLLGLKRTELM